MAIRMRSKYGSVRTNGFASKKEHRRHQELVLLEKAKAIRDLETQVKYHIFVNGHLICTYIADFRYFDEKLNAVVVEDCKGYRTREYLLKKKLMKAVWNVDILET